MELNGLLKEIRSCTICEEHLPLGPNPVLRASETAKILIVGQAPGTAVHKSGIPWDDPSGKRLRSWMDVSEETFYDESKIAIIPMGFCYPGKGKGGDLPPRKECEEHWHQKLWAQLLNIELTLVIGQYAQQHFFGKSKKKTLTDTVRNFEEYLPKYLPLVHPSPRNIHWFQKNMWFEDLVIPELRNRVLQLL